MSLILGIVFAYLVTWNLPDEAYVSRSKWKFPKAEVRGVLGGLVGISLSVLWITF